MRAREALEQHREDPRVFGSVATGTDDEDSDLDLLIDPVDGMSLFDLGGIYYDLEQLLPVKVDVAIARSLRPRYKERILAEARPL